MIKNRVIIDNNVTYPSNYSYACITKFIDHPSVKTDDLKSCLLAMSTFIANLAKDHPDHVLKPTQLTFENGVKSLDWGVKQPFLMDCLHYFEDEDPAKSCPTCKGWKEYYEFIPINWVSIKAIYRYAIDNLGVKL